ncbi:reverse transcriptase [Gossypium australe]|uniref:Reverse transcriptase n=1 Tax=Gossypium australe TaxID=47621 RepID=A0A5B6W6W0_9ROSI|nr:reverse transcriptase [Gossypium australe]
MLNEVGNVATNGNEVEEIAQNYFIDIFATKGIGNLEHILSGVKSCITDNMNQLLTTKYTGEEVFVALKGIGPMKATSLDGYPTIFFQKFWHIIGREVSNFCIGILNGDCCIDEAQTAFIPGRLITDNVLLTYKVINSFKQKRTGGMLYFVLNCNQRKGINSISYSIVIKGKDRQVFRPTRGLREKGLMDYLLICSEGWSSLMRMDRQEGLIEGAKGQCVNYDKSTTFYNSNAFDQILNVQNSTNPKKYLGLPNMVGRGKKVAFPNRVTEHYRTIRKHLSS